MDPNQTNYPPTGGPQDQNPQNPPMGGGDMPPAPGPQVPADQGPVVPVEPPAAPETPVEPGVPGVQQPQQNGGEEGTPVGVPQTP